MMGMLMGMGMVGTDGMGRTRQLTVCECTAGNWVCLTQSRGAIETCRAGGELGDGVHDDCWCDGTGDAGAGVVG